MRADITVVAVYPHPRARVWQALVSAEALSAWLMPTDFRPVVGHGFTFRTTPRPGFDGVVRCRVLEISEPDRMVWSWLGGPVDTTVTFTLAELGPSSTRLRFEQTGFHGLGAQFARLILTRGWKKMAAVGLPAHLDRQA
ncbi:SRPBCC family protein [Amycolatopsis sp. H20-H5]|uniref:SRPBCC family protein n=1 Tax=Amycolatopsis sp. H20-H5 TaxID=3046309 RepID=UPI002DB7E9ED|nr:SRPBCC domain-containing protein [Amycolatopsis sp. H20-H5]MEC3980592.1 SRPBCC domain-containing protein [Amycolatopsis sp. H20-H5]